MHHIIYKSYLPSGKYYIGRHSTKNLNDGYYGSGNWIRSLSEAKLSELNTVHLEEHETFEKLLEAEERWLSKVVGTPLCMNWNDRPVGFASGDRNPNRDPLMRKKISERTKGENNPMSRQGHTEEAKKKISEATKGENNPFFGKNHTEETKKRLSDKRKLFRYTDEQKAAISVRRKEQFRTGERLPTKGFAGLSHSEDTKKAMSESAKTRERVACIHCGKISAINVHVRWHGDNCKMR